MTILLPEPGHPDYLRTREYTLTSKAAAAMIVALTSQAEKAEQVSAALARKSQAAIALKYGKRVAALWNEANGDNLTLLVQVLRNNPGKTLDQIIARPDVKEALIDPYLEAAEKSEKVLRQAWDASVDNATKHVKGELALIKQEWAGGEADEGVLDQLIGDLHANAEGMQKRLLAAMKDRETFAQRVKMLSDDSARRARYSTTVAVGSADSSLRRKAFALIGLHMRWRARMDDRTCKECRRLNGMVVSGTKQQFPHGDLKVYKGVLYGPPRHPSCRCVLVPTFKPTT